MDLTIPLVVLCVLSLAAGVWDLVKSNARDVLRTASFVELGLLLGTICQLVVPGGFALGAIGGFALGVSRLDRMTVDRRSELDGRLRAAPDEVSSLLVLHDRIDELTRPMNPLRRAAVFTSLLFVMFFGVGLIGVGMATGVWPSLLLGSGMLFLPLTQGTRMLVEFEERRELHTRLAVVAVPGADLLEPPTAGAG